MRPDKNNDGTGTSRGKRVKRRIDDQDAWILRQRQWRAWAKVWGGQCPLGGVATFYRFEVRPSTWHAPGWTGCRTRFSPLRGPNLPNAFGELWVGNWKTEVVARPLRCRVRGLHSWLAGLRFRFPGDRGVRRSRRAELGCQGRRAECEHHETGWWSAQREETSAAREPEKISINLGLGTIVVAKRMAWRIAWPSAWKMELTHSGAFLCMSQLWLWNWQRQDRNQCSHW